jgi:hypothetical protein
MRKLGLLLLTAILAAPLASRADGSIQIDVGAAIAKPFGQVQSGANLGDQVAWGFPLQGDVQFRFLKNVAVGPYVRYAPTSLGSPTQNVCSANGISCDASDLSFGVMGEYRFSDRLEGGPWLGALVGWEMLKTTESKTVTGSPTPQKWTETDSGLQAGVRAGMDFELGGITLGPWAAFQAAQFSSWQADSGGKSTSGSISSKALHGWFEVGVRLSLLL